MEFEKRLALTYTLDEQQITITVCRATAKAGIQRYLLASKGNAENEKEPTDEATKILRLILYPDLVSATVAIEGLPWPMEFDQFEGLPEDLVNQWGDAVYKLNPHWRPTIVEGADDDQKKRRSKSE